MDGLHASEALLLPSDRFVRSPVLPGFPSSKMWNEMLALRTIHELVDQFMRDAHGIIMGIIESDAFTDFLGRPLVIGEVEDNVVKDLRILQWIPSVGRPFPESCFEVGNVRIVALACSIETVLLDFFTDCSNGTVALLCDPPEAQSIPEVGCEDAPILQVQMSVVWCHSDEQGRESGIL